MEDQRHASVGEAIASKLTTNGHVPEGGVLAEIQYVTAAKVRVFDADGRERVTYQFFDNLGGDDDTKMSLGRRLVWETERQAGRR